MASQNTQRSSPLLIAIAWAIVVLPLLWGLTYTVRNALKIFSTGTPAHAAIVCVGAAGGVRS